MADIIDVAPTITTTDATPVTAHSVGFTSNRVATGRFLVVAHSSDGDKASWEFVFLALRNGSTITILAQLLGLIGHKTLGALLWDTYLAAGNGVIEVKVKGANGKNINWHTELLYGRALAPAS